MAAKKDLFSVKQAVAAMLAAGVLGSPFKSTDLPKLLDLSEVDETNIVVDDKKRRYLELDDMRVLCPKDWDGFIESLTGQITIVTCTRDLVKDGKIVLKQGTILANIR